MQYLQQNFDKNDILRVVRALAIFRPSLIALQMPLTEEDETFVERCVQRSLIVRLTLSSYRTSIHPYVGARKTNIIQWNSDGGMETNRRNMSGGHGVLHAHRMESTGPNWTEEIHLRGMTRQNYQ